VLARGGVILRRRLVARRFAAAISKGDVGLHYQPIVSLRDGNIAAAEALIRWRTAGGWVPPSAFLPHLEERRDARRLHSFVLDAATAQARAWEQSGHGIQVTVNVSPRYVDGAMVDQIAQALHDTGLAPQLLHLELTEHEDGPWFGARATALQELRDLGVSISIDDFGRGESSLDRLVSLPLDVLKIDRDFIAGIGYDRRSSGVVKSATDLAHTLEMSAVGEGVETPEQWHALREWGCDYAQGFLISPPLPPEQLMPALLSTVIPTIDRLSTPADVERRVGAVDRRRAMPDRRRRGADEWPRAMARPSRR
jgi:EAL domain-containing protein (putative c-di-GMP-specific phosphodiesterase class I)